MGKLWLLVLFMVGCAPKPPPTDALAVQSVNAVQLALVPFQMEDQKNRPLTMTADGVVTGPHGLWGRVAGDGSVTYPDGKLRGRLLSDGRLVDEQNAALATIAADGSAKVADMELRFGSDGVLSGGKTDIRIQLLTRDPKVNRVAMLVLLFTLLRP
jgi:hypothetical protein